MRPPISIHALLAESDDPVNHKDLLRFQFQSTLSLRRATLHGSEALSSSQFQSTLSLRRATRAGRPTPRGEYHFNPRSPCGERLVLLAQDVLDGGISIHALLAESDQRHPQDGQSLQDFNPRSPCGERPVTWMKSPRRPMISIHALLAESDMPPHCSPIFRSDFNPRSPCGERRDTMTDTQQQPKFQSTLSLRRATAAAFGGGVPSHISIHALLAESDVVVNFSDICLPEFQSTLSLRRATGLRVLHPGFYRNFNPRSPCGERRCPGLHEYWFHGISIHALLAESDARCGV